VPTSLNLAKVVVVEITILGSRCGDLGLALKYLRNGWVDPRPLIEAFYPFAQAAKAFVQPRRPGALKVLVEFARAAKGHPSNGNNRRDDRPGVEEFFWCRGGGYLRPTLI